MKGHFLARTKLYRRLRPVNLVKIAILAGNREAVSTPAAPLQAMVEVGGRPLLWHLMMHFAHGGLNDFVIGLGKEGSQIKRYLLDLCNLGSDLRIHLKNGRVERRDGRQPDRTVDLLEAGSGPLLSLLPHLGRGTFMLCRADALSDLDPAVVLDFHRSHGRLGTIVAVQPEARFGRLDLVGDEVVDFTEKPRAGEGWTSSSFFVLEPDIFDFVDADDTEWELSLVERLADAGELMAYKHESFWRSVEALRDKQMLESLWQSSAAPWKNWREMG